MASNSTVAGSALIVGGAILAMTGVGAVVGLPMVAIGFGIIFPNFTKAAILLAFFLLFASIYWF